ncbi:hypothetical protein IG206_01495 [Candidatus Parvarchaeota archaeon]|jgi:hypothetical protein|nr:hypothetical protein [Candidatus Acidifodinimicrobium mancum]
MLLRQKRAQVALDYLVIVGVALSLIVVVVGVLVGYSNSLSVAFGQDTLSTAASTIAGQANYVYSLAPGSMSTAKINFPTMDFPGSHFCGKELILSHGGSFYVAQADTNVSGLLPATPGLNDVLVRSVEINGTDNIQVGLDRALAFVGFNYTLSGNTLNYTVNFYNYTGSIIKSQQFFKISIYSSSGVLMNSTVESANSGTYSGSFLLVNPQNASALFVAPTGSGSIFSTCI